MFTPLNSIKRSSRNSGSYFPYKEILDSLRPRLLEHTLMAYDVPNLHVQDGR
jgi:hypothetical protein